MSDINDVERIALFLDHENLALGVKEHLGGQGFDFQPIADALAERGRVVVRRAYADWSYFNEDRRSLTRHHVELIEITQRMGASRKNAADIKMAVDALELAFERDYISTFVFCTGDSDFTPLVHKLRELNKNVIGVGVRASTSRMLPPACDEFLFYDTLEGVEPGRKPTKSATAGGSDRRDRGRGGGSKAKVRDVGKEEHKRLKTLVTQTLSGLQRKAEGPVLGSAVKRALLRKDPTFNEADFGFRGFAELLRYLEKQGSISLKAATGGDNQVDFPDQGRAEREAFEVLARVVDELDDGDDAPPLSGLKNEVRKHLPDFSEKTLGYTGFLQFTKAADTRGYVDLLWSDEDEDWRVGRAEKKK